MAKKKNTPLLLGIIVLVLLMAFFFYKSGFFSKEIDSFSVENKCNDLKFEEWDKISPTITNTGKTSSYFKFCLSSDQFTFENEDKLFCTSYKKVLPFNNVLQSEFKINTAPEFEDAKKAALEVKISCKKMLLFFRKSCGTLEYTCNFDKLNLLGQSA